MIRASDTQTDPHLLSIAMDCRDLPVSYLSSPLRVVQAALRETARGSEENRQAFSQQPQPVLFLTAHVSDEDLVLRFAFSDPLDSSPLAELTERVSSVFLERFTEFLKGLPQRGLWGASVAGSQRRRYESLLARRMDQLRLELRRFPRARLRFDRHTILFDGDRLEID